MNFLRFYFVSLILFQLGCNDGGSERVLPSVNPCAFGDIDLQKHGSGPFRNIRSIRSIDKVLDARLNIAFSKNTIAGCPTNLRNYNGSLVGETLRAKPGDTLRILLENNLPTDTPNNRSDHNIPHNFNFTNLHTHGLHVSPSGNSDNVLLNIAPQTSQQYEIKIPEDHAPGTFWYHPHLHGSTALQVGSGMAGALIIEGGLDDVPEIEAAKEQVMLFQQIIYNEDGEVPDFSPFKSFKTWPTWKRQTLINGQVFPTIHMRPGEVQRFRLIHGGTAATLLVELEGHQLHEIAVDGLALGHISTWDQVELNSGYRSDVLIKAKPLEPGQKEAVYLLIDAASSAQKSLHQAPEERGILARVVVSGEPLNMILPKSSSLAHLKPFLDIEDAELNGDPQKVEFNIWKAVCPDEGGLCRACETDEEEGCKKRYTVDNRSFSKTHIRTLKLGTASEWTLSSLFANHPFHIHVNPFQMTRKGPAGNPETVWRDTVLIRNSEPPLKIRSRYEDYPGKFVFHCHILPHEDQGMMQLVEVVN